MTVVSDWKEEIKKQIKDQKRVIGAFQFGSYIAKEVEKYGSEAMQLKLPFSEVELLNENLELIKLLTKTSKISILEFNDKTKPKKVKTNPIPGKPILFCE